MINWQEKGSLILGLTNGAIQKHKKILGLDMDGTLITVKSGSKFPTSSSDWKFLYSEKVVEKVKEYNENGYGIVIITNQHGIGLGKAKKQDITDKIEQIHKELGSMEIQVYIATDDDMFRKPNRGIWDMFIKVNGIEEEEECIKQSLFIGDAAGRKKTKTNKGDHSDFDYKFALNIGLTF